MMSSKTYSFASSELNMVTGTQSPTLPVAYAYRESGFSFAHLTGVRVTAPHEFDSYPPKPAQSSANPVNVSLDFSRKFSRRWRTRFGSENYGQEHGAETSTLVFRISLREPGDKARFVNAFERLRILDAEPSVDVLHQLRAAHRNEPDPFR